MEQPVEVVRAGVGPTASADFAVELSDQERLSSLIRREVCQQMECLSSCIPQGGGGGGIPEAWERMVVVYPTKIRAEVANAPSTLDGVLDLLYCLIVDGGVTPTDMEDPPCASPAVPTYNADCQIVSVAFGAPVVRNQTRTYNAEGQLTQIVDTWTDSTGTPRTRTCTYSYDAEGKRTSESCATV